MKKIQTKPNSNSLNFSSLEYLFENIRFLGIMVACGDHVQYINNVMSSISGYPLEELKEWTVSDFINILIPEDQQRALDDFKLRQKTTEKGYKTNYKVRGYHKTGREIEVEIHSVKVEFQGKLVDFITIRECKNPSEELETMFLNYLKEHLPEIVWIFFEIRSKVHNKSSIIEEIINFFLEEYNRRKTLSFEDALL